MTFRKNTEALKPIRIRRAKDSHGFTLIELLVVIAIISILSSTVISSLQKARIRARDNVRIQNLKELQNILELYFIDNGKYPKTFDPGAVLVKRGECSGNPDDYIPNVIPDYTTNLPNDPALNCGGIPHGLYYASNGIDYKIIIHNEGFYSGFFSDPVWDNGSNPCVVDGPSAVHIGIWTPGAACWGL